MKILLLVIVAAFLLTSLPAVAESPYIYGLHFWREGANLDCFNGKTGWITELKMSPDYAGVEQAQWKRIADEGHTIILRVDFDQAQTFPTSAADYDLYASRYAHWVERFKDYIHIWIIGNEEPVNYECFKKVRSAIHAVQPEAIVCTGDAHSLENATRDLKDYIDGYVEHGVNLDWVPDVDAQWPSSRTRPIYITEFGGDPPNPYNLLRSHMASVNYWNTTHDYRVQCTCRFVYYEFGNEYSSLQMEPMQIDDFREATANTVYYNAYAFQPIALTNVNAACPTETSAAITWNTDVPSTAQVEYWREGELTQSWSDFVDAGNTSHSITLSGLVPGATYCYQIKSFASNKPLAIGEVRKFKQSGPGSGTIAGVLKDRSGKAIHNAKITRNPDGYVYYTQADGSYSIEGVPAGVYSLTFETSEAGSQTVTGLQVAAGKVTDPGVVLSQKVNYLTNSSFESGTTGWTAYESGQDSQSGAWFGGISAHTGSKFLGKATNGPGSSGGLYQRVLVPNASGYTARIYSRIYRGDCPYITVRSRVGIDPFGGTNPNSTSIQWSGWDYGYNAWDSEWKELVSPAVTVSGSYATIFIDYDQLVPDGWHITCFDDAGLYGVRLQSQSVSTVAELKDLEDGVPVSISGRIATTNRTDFIDRIYIEDPDRSSGIMVYLGTSVPTVSEGNTVTVSGTMGTRSGERAVIQPTVTASAGTALKPVGMNNRAVGGSDKGYEAGPPAFGQKGVAGGVGLNNIGLLVRVFGEVKNTGSGYVMISDGAGSEIKVDTSRVSPQPGQGQFILVTGILSVEQSGTDLTPLVRARRSADIQTSMQ